MDVRSKSSTRLNTQLLWNEFQNFVNILEISSLEYQIAWNIGLEFHVLLGLEKKIRWTE